jgi:hypothetical protein
MQVEHILPLKQDGSESMKREVDEPLKVLESGRDEQRRRPSTLLVKLRLEDLFSIERQFFCSKLTQSWSLESH